MDHEAVEALRDRHPAWRILRAQNAPLILSFLGEFFVDGNRGSVSAGDAAQALDDHLYALNASAPADEPRYPKEPRAYLEDWASADAGFLRRFYPEDRDEVFYEVTPAFEKAYAFAASLKGRAFVGTESRLHTVVELLRQIAHGTEEDAEARLVELRRRREEIDAEIAAVEAGEVAVLDDTGVRDRFQQLSATARELLSDFREVEDNFRGLDRAAREKIAAWEGAKGELLADLVGSRSEITQSDQGRSFQAFYEFLLSEGRQRELTELLARVTALDVVDADARIRNIHHDWSEAADRTQRTVRQISEQLRRFLDDQVWLENRRVLDLVKAIEGAALRLREAPPAVGLEVELPGIPIGLPFERPLYQRPVAADIESLMPAGDEEVELDALFGQVFVDQARLADNIRAVLRPGSAALLEDIVTLFPIEQGAAEIVSYLALTDDDIGVRMEEGEVTRLEYRDVADPDLTRLATLPRVTVSRR